MFEKLMWAGLGVALVIMSGAYLLLLATPLTDMRPGTPPPLLASVGAILLAVGIVLACILSLYTLSAFEFSCEKKKKNS